jgi:diguanylate cyclase (GGDEF)-like protein
MNLLEAQKVLIADDDAVNRQVLADLLKPEYTVLLAKNGEQALERATRHAPDLILLDVMMPDLDGYEVLRRLRADPQLERIAVIFISGLDRPEDEANGLKMGAADYIAKPFNAIVVMARVALHLQLVRQRRMLERLANMDALTELANRRRFDEAFGLEWQRAQRSGEPLSLALLDIDCFKQYNDTYGHLQGDDCLRMVADTIGTACRHPDDFIARVGGEEFVAMLFDLSLEDARYAVARVVATVAERARPHAASVVAPYVTLSAGAIAITPDEERLDVLFERADAALYEAKRNGRNTFRFHQTPQAQEAAPGLRSAAAGE